jgi:hypothetical protein
VIIGQRLTCHVAVRRKPSTRLGESPMLSLAPGISSITTLRRLAQEVGLIPIVGAEPSSEYVPAWLRI